MIRYLLALVCFLMASTAAGADSLKVSVGGFAALDMFADSTRSFLEAPGNAPIERSNVTAGMTGRTQFSVRSSRLSVAVETPQAGIWMPDAYFELDLMGFNPDPGTAGNTEGSFMTSPSLRARQLFLRARTEDWELLAGQTWSLFGWQPRYFMSTADVTPLAGLIAARNAQIRVVRKMKVGEKTTWEFGAAGARPPQRDAQLPALDLGLRVSLDGRKAGHVGGIAAPRGLAPMSFGLSATGREFALPRLGGQAGELSYFPGGAIALNAFLPVITAPDETNDAGQTVSVVGEITIGRGYGDLFPGWTGNLTTDPGGANLDAGIGAVDSQGNFRLLEMRSYNLHMQYFLTAASRAWVVAGYGQLFSSNANLFVPANNKKVYSREEAAFAQVFHDLTEHMRARFEYAYSRTHYADGAINHNNRVQLSALLSF